jgi:hypothetical protein
MIRGGAVEVMNECSPEACMHVCMYAYTYAGKHLSLSLSLPVAARLHPSLQLAVCFKLSLTPDGWTDGTGQDGWCGRERAYESAAPGGLGCSWRCSTCWGNPPRIARWAVESAVR